MSAHPTPWNAFLAHKPSLGTLEGAMSGAQWAVPKAAVALHLIEPTASTRPRQPSGYGTAIEMFGKLDLLGEIQEYGTLLENWDGDNASPISNETLEAARRFVLAIPPFLRADVAPNPNGTISVYLEDEVGRAEMEIGRTRYSWSYMCDEKAAVSCSGSVVDVPSGPDVQGLLGMFRTAPRISILSLASERPSAPMSHMGLRYLHEWPRR